MQGRTLKRKDWEKASCMRRGRLAIGDEWDVSLVDVLIAVASEVAL